MKIFPAIDLRDGKAVRLYQGDYDQMTVYSEDPVDVARRFKENATIEVTANDFDRALSINHDFVRIEGDKVAPNAEKLSIAVNETLVWNITSDRAGELHVHSKPEQFVEFGEGETRAEITIETPGSVEVEDHETSAVVAILEVR